jgi:hypothetical protein
MKTLLLHSVCSHPASLRRANTQPRQRMTKVPKSLIIDFYCQDDVSRASSGKKDFKNGRQIRYLTSSIGLLHERFLSEHPSLAGKISKSTFFKLRPNYVLKPKCGNREQCLCILCTNIQVRKIILNIVQPSHIFINFS